MEITVINIPVTHTESADKSLLSYVSSLQMFLLANLFAADTYTPLRLFHLTDSLLSYWCQLGTLTASVSEEDPLSTPP